jgi:hypothetical protein
VDSAIVASVDSAIAIGEIAIDTFEASWVFREMDSVVVVLVASWVFREMDSVVVVLVVSWVSVGESVHVDEEERQKNRDDHAFQDAAGPWALRDREDVLFLEVVDLVLVARVEVDRMEKGREVEMEREADVVEICRLETARGVDPVLVTMVLLELKHDLCSLGVE